MGYIQKKEHLLKLSNFRLVRLGWGRILPDNEDIHMLLKRAVNCHTMNVLKGLPYETYKMEIEIVETKFRFLI